jgi:putative phosphotransacetylase
MHPGDGEKFGFKNGDWARVRVEGPRSLVFEKVLVRVKSNYVLEMHVDIDEANACALKPGDSGRIIG